MRHEKEIEIENEIEKTTMKVQLSLRNKIFHFFTKRALNSKYARNLPDKFTRFSDSPSSAPTRL